MAVWARSGSPSRPRPGTGQASGGIVEVPPLVTPGRRTYSTVLCASYP